MTAPPFLAKNQLRIARHKGQVLSVSTAWRACAQTDLRVEAVHLRRFYHNFASVRSSVTPPLPVPGMDTEAVLVETFEAGVQLCARHLLHPCHHWSG